MKKKIFVINNALEMKPHIEVEVEFKDGCCKLTDCWSGHIIGQWCSPEAAQQVWDDPQRYC